MVSSPFAPELCQKATQFALDRNPRDLRAALYASGAVSALCEADADVTQSMFRAFLSVTVVQLAMGDSVAADKTYMEVHLQKTSYLRADECVLAEELLTAVKNFDGERLDKAKKHRLVDHMDPRIRQLILDLKVSGNVGGIMKKKPPPAKAAPVVAVAPPPAAAAPTVNATGNMNLADIGKETRDIDIGFDGDDMDELAAAMEEMNDLTEGMEGGAEDEEGSGDEDDDVEDDEIDLR